MNPTGTLFLKRSEVSQLLQFPDYVRIVAEAFALHAQGLSMAPGLLHADGIDGEFHVKAGGLLGDEPRFAVKINGGFFKNRQKFGMPNIQGVIVLSDASNGYPLCVMDSVEITIQRTAAATAIAAQYLARPESSVCTLCGLGTQGKIQLSAIVRTLPIQLVHAWSPFPGEAEEFSRHASLQLGIEVRAAASLDEAARQSDVIVTCTPARQFYLRKSAVRAGTFIAAVGADSPDKQELEPALVASSKVVGDILGQIVKVGETHHAIDAGLMNREAVVAEIGEIIIGQKPGRVSADDIFIYDSTGTALQDVAAAAAVYKEACQSGCGIRIDLTS